MKVPDKKVLEAIKLGKDSKVLEVLYKEVMPLVTSWIRKNNGNNDDAFDVFQDAVLIFHSQVKQGKYNEKHAIGAFLYTVCKNLWINKVNKLKKIQFTDNAGEEDVSLENNVLDYLLDDEKKKLVEWVMSQVNERCREILHYTIYQNLSMEDISIRMGFASENAAKTANYQCKKNLIKFIKDNDNLKNILSS